MTWKNKLSLILFAAQTAFYVIYDIVGLVRDGFTTAHRLLTIFLIVQFSAIFVCYLLGRDMEGTQQRYHRIRPVIETLRHLYQLVSVGLTLTVFLGALLAGKSVPEIAIASVCSFFFTIALLALDFFRFYRYAKGKIEEKSKPYIDYASSEAPSPPREEEDEGEWRF